MMVLLLALGAARAQDPAAEAARLRDELFKLAGRNTWTGVDRNYRRLVELGVPLSPREHLAGGHAALAMGDTLLGYYRLERASEPPEGADPAEAEAFRTATADAEGIAGRFGKVAIYVGGDAVPVLYRDGMPFAQQDRDCITAAQRRISDQRTYRGLLPVGTYKIDAEAFEVVAGGDWVVVAVGER